MKKIYIQVLLLILLSVSFTFQNGFSQEGTIDVSNYTREDVMNIPYDQLLEMPLDQLLILADIVGVSLDELYEMILNKDVVSASKKVESSFDAPLSNAVITYDEIVASGARTLEEALRLAPGVIVREKTNGNFDIHIRGNDNLPPNQMLLYSENSITLVMINNRPVYNYVHGGTFWETLPVGIEDIDRIEVVRGPSSALYGPNAVSGVINIITKKPVGERLQVNSSVEAGNMSYYRAALGVGQQLNNKFGYRVTGNYFHTNRTTDLLYSVKRKQYMTVDELDTATIVDPVDNQRYLVYDPADSVALMFPDPGLAKQNMGTNLYLFYNQNENIGADFSAGYQFSDIISSSMGDNATTQVGRTSNTMYSDLRAHINDLRVQLNLLDGWQDIIKEDTGFKIDVFNANANAEYDIKLNKINIRPGFGYQFAQYNDLAHLKEGQGFLNGTREFTVTAASLRFDAAPIEKLRLIAALRAEKYNTHKDMYFSYQFIGSYKLNDKNLIRAVVSKANRSPFLVDQYANYLWNREGRPVPGFIYFKGTPNLDLLTMDQLEIGYRSKPINNIQLDVDAFYTSTKNFGGLYPDSVNLNAFVPERPYARMIFRNIDLESTQMGLTASVMYVANKDLYLKVFGTVQQTELKNMITIKQESILANMLATAKVLFDTDTINRPQALTGFPVIQEDGENEATPSFYGGLVVDYILMDEKLHLNFNSYYMSKQTFKSKYPDIELDPQININLKVSYSLITGLNIYLSARNILSDGIEFGYMDDIKPTFLGGINYNF